MKTKNLLFLVGALFVAIIVWVAQAAWTAHKKLVTLDVRNAPLAQVLKKIEKQTWTKIRSEDSLDAQITLNLKRQPLSEALNRIAQQAGARWTTTHAVYSTKFSVVALEQALRTDGKIDKAGWIKIAPDADAMEAGLGGPVTHLKVNPKGEETEPLPADGPLKLQFPGPPLGENGMQPPPPGLEPGQGEKRMLVRREANGGVMFFGGPNGQMELWSPEEVVIESALTERLGKTENPAPTATTAEQMAKKVNAHWTTLISFRKSAVGLSFGGLPSGGPGSGPGGPNPSARFVNLTPQQRVQQARERSQWQKQATQNP